MRRLVPLAACLLAVTLTGGLRPRLASAEDKKPTTGEIIDRAEKGVVLLTVRSAAGDEIGSGSGFVIDPAGVVVTNAHVVRGGAKARAEFKDGTKCDVKGVRAIDFDADVAVLELADPPKGLKALPLGPKEAPRVGSAVIAIGHPQGFNFTVTTGIVSAVRKTGELPRELAGRVTAPAEQAWVQTTAPISGGNSGGPLLDDAGRVIGINTWKAAGDNLGFAVHVAHVAALVEKHRAARPVPLAEAANPRAGDAANPLAAVAPRVAQMARDFTAAEREFVLAKAREEQTGRKADVEDPRPKYARRFYAIADSDRRSVTAVQALVVALDLAAEAGDDATAKQALARLGEDHAADRGAGYVARRVAGANHPGVPAFLRKLASDSPHRDVKAVATLALASRLLWVSETEPAARAEAVKLLEACTGAYRDVRVDGVGVGDAAGPLLHRAKHLTPGAPAQEIAGEDADGKRFKLSEYRGKVVLLDFYADWCPHCVAMYPHERKLAEDYKARPFALLGVNGDSKDTFKQLVADKKVTWRSWWAGQDGEVLKQWQIDGWPTLFVIDHAGVIRHVVTGRPDPEALRKAVEKLVAEAEAAGKK